MKKLNLFIVAIIAMLGFTFNVKAAGVALKCEDQKIKVGGSTTCTVSVNGLTSTINTATITLSKSETIDVTEISNVKPNTTAGWATATSTTAGAYSFANTAGASDGEIFSFTLGINSKASELGEDESCGEICISAAKFDSISLTNTKTTTGACFTPIVVEEPPCEDCNPETGAFANYAIIAASILIAGAAVVIARKSSKFFRV